MIDINELRRRIDWGYKVANGIISELLDRLETAESEALEEARLNGMGAERELALMAKLEAAEKAVTEAYQRGYETGQEEIEKERDALRDRIEVTDEVVRELEKKLSTGMWRVLREENEALRAKIAEMERQEPSEQDASVRKAWARFSHELHRSPDAPYPGMADAFEQHFSQSFIDREWRAEAATWAAAWKAAKRHGAQPAPSGTDDIVREVLRDCCGTFHGSRHRITCEKYKGKKGQETSCEDE